ncbi:hypothetical protein QQ045_031969 [Rhodiola kirilowii]
MGSMKAALAAMSNSILIYCFMLLILSSLFKPSCEYTIKLIHIDSQDSPYYNANDTLELRYKRMAEISELRYRQIIQDLEEEARARLQADLVEARLKQVTRYLPSEDGLEAFSAILERFSIENFIWGVDDKSQTAELIIPSCNYSMNMYVRRLANEKEMMKYDPRFFNDIRNVMRLHKKIVGFDGTGNVSVSDPLLYDTRHLKIHAADGFGSLEFPQPTREVSGKKSKIEFMIVVNITDYDVDEINLGNLKRFIGPDLVISDPFPHVTLLYSLYF